LQGRSLRNGNQALEAGTSDQQRQPCHVARPEGVALRRHQSAAGDAVALPRRVEHVAPQSDPEQPESRVWNPCLAGLPMTHRAKADTEELRNVLSALAGELACLAELFWGNAPDAWALAVLTGSGQPGPGRHYAKCVWRSRDVEGPYVAWTGNPSLTQRDLDPNRPSPITSTGHAQFIELKDGSWWTVFLGTRPYRGNQYNLGRETFLLPVSWTDDGWPMVLPRGARVPAVAQRPALPRDPSPPPMSGPITWSETFADSPGPQWLTLHAPQLPWFRTGDGGLRIVPGTTSLGAHGAAGNGQPTYLAHRLQHHKAWIEATLEPAGLEVGELAGLALFQNETHHVVAAVERSDAGAALVLRLRNGKDDPLPGRELKRVPLASNDAALSLRFQVDNQHLDVSWRSGTEHWNTLLNRQDASLLSVDHAGGFIGNTFGPYAVHQ